MSEVQISKTLLILRANTNSTQAAEQFLRNREWVIFSTTSLKDFLTYIIQKKPSFVMLSVDHPNKKVAVMPRVLTQSFPICVFAFAEQSSSHSFRKLQDMQCPYKINPPATGPAIERMVNKYLRDLEKKTKDPDDKTVIESSGKSAVDSKMNVIQSSGSASGDTQIKGDGQWNQAASIFSQLFEGDESAKGEGGFGDIDGSQAGNVSGSGGRDAKNKGGGTWVPSDTKETKNHPQTAGTLNSAGGEASSGGGSVDGAGGFINGGSPNQKGAGQGQTGSGQAGFLGPNSGNGQAGFLGPNSEGSKDNGSSQTANAQAGFLGANSGSDSENSSNQNGSGQGAPLGTNSSNAKENGSDSKGATPGAMAYNEDDYDDTDRLRKLPRVPREIHVGKERGKKQSADAGEAEDVASGNLQRPKKYDKEQKIITVMGKGGRETMDSIILKGTKQALDDTVEVLDGEVSQELSDSSQVACIVVESDRFNGYLIAALGKNRKMDGKFIKAIQEKLFKFLKDNGEAVSEKDNMNLKIKKVEFEDWAVDCADFLKKSVHNGEEIAMAFFPVPNVRPEVGESASSTMASVKLSEIEGDKTVEFNMYVYLPTNKKYVLYTPKGGKFYGNQKDRLQGKGVSEVHMLKSEVSDLSKYKAQNYLNTLIDGYKKKKATVNAA